MSRAARVDPRLPATLYGKWLPVENPGAVDRLDDAVPTRPIPASEMRSAEASGGKTVADARARRLRSPQVVGGFRRLSSFLCLTSDSHAAASDSKRASKRALS